jgi:hypothetical protein
MLAIMRALEDLRHSFTRSTSSHRNPYRPQKSWVLHDRQKAQSPASSMVIRTRQLRLHSIP